MEQKEFAVELTLEDGYRFSVDFEQEGVPPLLVDEPEPLGRGEGPNAARLLGAAIGNCLGASLLFCLQRSRVEVLGLKVAVDGTIVRNEKGRFRIDSVRVRLDPEVAEHDRDRIDRCIGMYEDFCIVTQSVRDGLKVDVEVGTGSQFAA
jgi:organic hydroperoxide reductase OsmC/OhrA